jgi:hypothetical protein
MTCVQDNQREALKEKIEARSAKKRIQILHPPVQITSIASDTLYKCTQVHDFYLP